MTMNCDKYLSNLFYLIDNSTKIHLTHIQEITRNILYYLKE